MLISKLNKKPEIFYTFQGEGINIGKPVIFIRTATCNLHCNFCDTAYTWNWKGTPWKHDKNKKYELKENSVRISDSELADEMIAQSVKYKCTRFTITGGEPLLQQSQFIETVKILRAMGYEFQYDFETNGTIMPESELLEDEMMYFNCSPKLAHSGNSKQLRHKPEVIKALVKSRKASFKFVVDSPRDVREVKEIQKECDIPDEIIYLMPEGITKKSVSDKAVWLSEICKKNNWNITTRLHVLVYGGAKRGV